LQWRAHWYVQQLLLFWMSQRLRSALVQRFRFSIISSVVYRKTRSVLLFLIVSQQFAWQIVLLYWKMVRSVKPDDMKTSWLNKESMLDSIVCKRHRWKKAPLL